LDPDVFLLKGLTTRKWDLHRKIWSEQYIEFASKSSDQNIDPNELPFHYYYYYYYFVKG
jgi:hypothetical protein